MRLNKSVWYGLLGVITSGWVFNLIGPLFINTYKPDPSINAVFMIVIGAIFGADAVSKVKKPNEDEPPRKGEASGDT